jgi:hypothetical protein
MSKHPVERSRHLGEIQRAHEQRRVLNLPAATGAHEAPKLLLIGLSLLVRLLLEGAERSKFTLSVDDPFHGGDTERTDQLVLQVCDAHIEAECLHIGPSEIGAESGPLETALEVALLCGVTEARQSDVKSVRAEPIEEASDGLRTPNWDNRDALNVKIPTKALS